MVHTASVAFSDLQATVYLDELPSGVDREVDALYSSLFSTVDYFSAYEDARPTGAVVMAAPRHVLLFTVEGDTVEVLNKTILMAPEDARRACLAVFRAVSGARRIHLEVMFPAVWALLDESSTRRTPW